MIITGRTPGEQTCWSEPWTGFSARTVPSNAPGAEDLHRPGADDRGPRQARQITPPLHQERRHAVAGQGNRGSEACWSGAGDQHRRLLRTHLETLFRRTVCISKDSMSFDRLRVNRNVKWPTMGTRKYEQRLRAE